MRLKKVHLKNFRNFEEKEFLFNPFITFIVGENSVGKTNLLESIYVVCNGRGFREKRISELVCFNSNIAYISATFFDGKNSFNFKVVINTKLEKKYFLIDNSKRRFRNYRQNLMRTVLFSPEQIKIVVGSPENRRNYIDEILSNVDITYEKSLINYKNALYKRNKVLERIRDKRWNSEELVFWNKFLIENGSYLQKRRRDYVNYLNEDKTLNSYAFRIDYKENTISFSAFEKSFEKELLFKKTLIGPQRDEFIFSIRKKGEVYIPVSNFGSRSEQRLMLFYLKLKEVKYLERTTSLKPLLLLDDLFSELDVKNKLLVLSFIKDYQSIITTTDPFFVEEFKFPKDVILLKNR